MASSPHREARQRRRADEKARRRGQRPRGTEPFGYAPSLHDFGPEHVLTERDRSILESWSDSDRKRARARDRARVT
jgi:hypothetical protein